MTGDLSAVAFWLCPGRRECDHSDKDSEEETEAANAQRPSAFPAAVAPSKIVCIQFAWRTLTPPDPRSDPFPSQAPGAAPGARIRGHSTRLLDCFVARAPHNDGQWRRSRPPVNFLISEVR
jgi:hypothetical protein